MTKRDELIEKGYFVETAVLSPSYVAALAPSRPPPLSRGSSRSRMASPNMFRLSHHEGQAETRPQGKPWRLLHVPPAFPTEQSTPTGKLGRQTESEEAQRSLTHDRPPMLMLKMMISGAPILGRTCRQMLSICRAIDAAA